MKKIFASLILIALSNSSFADEARKELKEQYAIHSLVPSDIHEHLPNIRRIARECSHVTEIGVRSMVSTWALLAGLADNPKRKHTYVGIDIGLPPSDIFHLAQDLSKRNGIDFSFITANDMTIMIEPTDLLFLDTLHIYQQLTYELEKFSAKTRKYIIMHDTVAYARTNDLCYKGDFSEYPAFIDRNKQGLWVAVTDFLMRHPEWKLHEHHNNNHGLTILKRKYKTD